MAPQVGETITGAVMDPDGGLTDVTWQWYRSMTPDMMDSWMKITDATAAAYMLMDDDYGYYLRATAMYTDGEGMGKMASKETMMVPMNAAPVITGDAAPNYAENGTGPVATYTGTDPEGVTVTWSLSGDDAEDFEISEDGMLTFKESPNFEAPADMDTDNVYMVTVEASDGTTDNVMQAVTVTVTNVDEPGMVTLWAGTTVALTMAPQVGDTITGAVMDPDGGEMVESWQWARSTDV